MMRTAVALVLAAGFTVATPLAGQSLAQRVAQVTDGSVRMSFAARAGVCGSGRNSIQIMDDEDDEEWESDCERGPVRVSLRLQGGRVTDSDVYVAGRWRPGAKGVTDLDLVPAGEAAALLLDLGRRASGDRGEELITAAALADSVVIWPQLIALAKDQSVGMETRRHAVFWLGQAAGVAATRGLDSIAGNDRGDIEVRKQAVFALSQRPTDEGVPALIQIARTNPHAELRKSALFWLGQSEDPRALALFEELLR
jgi:HEAT repeat protein